MSGREATYSNEADKPKQRCKPNCRDDYEED